jgi:hypothetical protein
MGTVGIVGAVGYKLAPAGKTQIILESLGGGNSIIRKIY